MRNSKRFVACLAGSYVVAVVGCSGKTEPYPGGLMVAVQTDLVAPKDVTAVGLYISSDGKPLFADTRDTAPNGEVHFPATIAVIADANRPRAVIRVRAVAFARDGKVRVLRDAVTTVPRGRTGILRTPLLWINQGSGTGARSDIAHSSRSGTSLGATTPADAVRAGTRLNDAPLDALSNVKSACLNPDETYIDGECKDARVDGDALPEYREEDVFGGGHADGTGGTCFDVKACFASAAPLTLDAGCSAVLGDGQGAGDPNLSLGVALKDTGAAETSTGECLGNGVCVVPLDKDAGYTIAGNEVHLAAAFCKRIARGEALGVVVTRACPSKTDAVPACGPASSVNSDHPIRPDGGAQEAGSIDFDGGPSVDAAKQEDGGLDATVDSSVDATVDSGNAADSAADSGVSDAAPDGASDGGADSAADGGQDASALDGGPPDGGAGDAGPGPFTLQSGQAGATGIVATASGIYWIAKNAFGAGRAAIRGVDPNNPASLLINVTAPGNAPSVTALAVNIDSVIWTNFDGELLRCAKDGSNCNAPFQPGTPGTFSNVTGLLADDVFIHVASSNLTRCPIGTGCSASVVLSTSPPAGLTEDYITKTVYWSEGTSLSSLKSCNNCMSPTTNFSTTGSVLGPLAVGPSGYVSFIDVLPGPSTYIHWCPPATSCGAFAYGPGQATAIAEDDQAVYFTKGASPSSMSEVWAYACVGTVCGTPVLVSAEANITSLAAYQDSVYWTTQDGRVMRAPRPTGL